MLHPYTILQYTAIPLGFMVLRNVVDLNDPLFLSWARFVSAISIAIQTGALLYIYNCIVNNEKGSKKIFVRPTQLVAPEFRGLSLEESSKDDKFEISIADYEIHRFKDMSQRQSIIILFALILHFVFTFVPSLLVVIVATPRIIIQSPFFRLYIKKQNPDIIRELRRPWPDPTPSSVSKIKEKYVDWIKEWGSAGGENKSNNKATNKTGKKKRKNR